MEKDEEEVELENGVAEDETGGMSGGLCRADVTSV